MIIIIQFLVFVGIIRSQVDYPNSWEDFYSYQNVNDFIKVDDRIYLAKGTDLKILDAVGILVYFVLLIAKERTETTFMKIAIID